MHLKFRSPDYYEQRPQWLRPLVAGIEQPSAMFVLGDGDDRQRPAAVVLDRAPGHVFARHAHVCERLEIVVSGSLTTEDGTTLGPGDVMIARPGELYGPSTAGPGGCVTFEVFGTLEGVYRPVYEAANGALEQRDLLREALDAARADDSPASP